MNSRERVKKVLNHGVPDRIPIDFGTTRSTGISSIAYNELRKEVGINTGLAHVYDFIQQLSYPEEEIMDLFHVDFIDAGRAFLKSKDAWREWTLNDGSKCLIPKFLNVEVDSDNTVYLKGKNGFILGKKPKTSLYIDQCYWVYKDLPSIPKTFKNEDLGRHVWAIPLSPWHIDIFNDEHFKTFVNGIKELYENTDYSVILSVGGSLSQAGMYLRGMDNFLCDIYLDKSGTKRLFDKLVEKSLIVLERVLKCVGKYIDIIRFGDDLGGQTGPLMSPEIFREIFKPKYKRMWDFVHENSNCKVALHSCGSVYELLADLIDAGIDIINPLQTTAKDMEPEKLKKKFGKDIIFWGGCCNTRDVLTNGTPKDVEEDVKKRIEILGCAGGLIFNQVHNIQANVPPENIIALFETAYKYGFYNE